MPKILAWNENLNELNAQFEQSPLREPVFLNSVPKCGTHLFRNIVRMFVPVEQQYHKAFIQIPILRQHLRAYSTENPMLSWGHMLFSDDSAMALQKVRHTVLVRDPYDWVLARARFFLSDTFRGNVEHLKRGGVSTEEVLNMMIFGIYEKAPTMLDTYLHNAVGWIGTSARMMKMEDLVHAVVNLDSDEAEEYFTDILAFCGINRMPPDWRERVRIGSDRKQSGTARENLSGQASEVPDELPEAQKRLVEFAMPGLRSLLGYH